LYDCGITGRKLACDAHGIYAPHGGGATSGKDMSKPDRKMKILADMLAQKIHKKINQIQSVDEICIGLAFEMGGTRPIGIKLINNNLIKNSEELLEECLEEFDFSVVPEGKMIYRAHPWVKEIEKLF
jgi:S-adenosylmethionine synthetase